MPTIPHEAPLSVLREDPTIVPWLLRESLGVDVPAFERADIVDADFTQAVPAEYRADLVVCLRAAAGEPVMGIVVEVQLRRDDRKRRTWPLYLAALHARLDCPTCLVVLAVDDAIAAWAARPIATLQPGVLFRPVVIGPSMVPVIAAEDAPAHPWQAVFSAVAHGNDPGGLAIVLAAIAALTRLDDERASIGYDLIFASLDDVGQRELEKAMEATKHKYKYISAPMRKIYQDGEREGHEAGVREGLETVRVVLRDLVMKRLGELDAETDARIARCEDLQLLVTTVGDVAAAMTAAAAERVLAQLR